MDKSMRRRKLRSKSSPVQPIDNIIVMAEQVAADTDLTDGIGRIFALAFRDLAIDAASEDRATPEAQCAATRALDSHEAAALMIAGLAISYAHETASYDEELATVRTALELVLRFPDYLAMRGIAVQ
jgi:hypothetical protein